MPEAEGPALDLGRIAQVLDRHGVDYPLCGGAAATAYGSTRETADADIVAHRHPVNLQRLADAMRELKARLRVAGLSDYEARQLPVQVGPSALGQLELSTWMTDAGAFDVLTGLEDEHGRVVPYEELAQRANRLRVGERVIVRAAALDDIITAKERADRPKDREALPELRVLRDQRASQHGSGQ